MERDRRLEIKVGIFVILGIVGLVVILGVLGSEENLFEENYVLHASFSDISGLREGAAVRLAGLDVGIVTEIEFPSDISEKQIYVHMRVAQRFSERIRRDSVAEIKTQGVLGDKYISLSLGTPPNDEHNYDAWLKSKDPEDLLAGVSTIKENIVSITDQIDVALKGEDGANAGQSIVQILESLRNIVTEVEDGKGLIHALVYDRKAARDLEDALASIDTAAQSIQAITTEIEQGDGTIHALIYDDQISDLVTSLESAADNLDAVVVDIREGDGVIHSLIYTDEGKNLIANLTDASDDIRQVTESIKEGEGTLGALIADPTVYEDVKTLLGGAKRNKILRSYVRDTIRRNERGEGLSDGSSVEDPD
jgi:phospholipid/cholesterol/gamma-HCH transport system substrate-binding protein